MKYPIPNAINALLLIVAPVICISCLYFFENTQFLWVEVLAALIFGLVNNTNFSLLHEATHGVLFSNPRANAIGGNWAASFFPTSLTLQKIFHLGHHRRNRTDEEILDQYYPTDNIFMKRFVIFCLLVGLYYPSSPLANILFLFCPWIFDSKNFRKNDLMKASSFDSMLKGIDRRSIPKNRMRLEILFSIAVQVALFYFLDLSFWTWFICYYSFNIFWSSLQYTDHAWSKRSVREGAWNLKVNPLIEKIFLNYHWHLNHHRYPNVPWIHLPKLTKTDDPNPSFWSIYWKLWKGPTPITEPDPKVTQEFEDEIYIHSGLRSSSEIL